MQEGCTSAVVIELGTGQEAWQLCGLTVVAVGN